MIEIKTRKDKRGEYFEIEVDPYRGAAGIVAALSIPGYVITGFDRKHSKVKVYIVPEGGQ